MPKTKVDLYKLLQVSKQASNIEIKKNFHILARKVHPDKNRDDPKANENFQALRKAYEILIDKRKREIYDKNGYFDDNIESFMDAYEKFRGIKISENDIEEYQKAFKNSEEEKEDLIEYFESHNGDISRILGSIIGSSNEDVDRFKAIFKKLIKSKEYPKKVVSNFKKCRILSLEELDEETSDIDEAEVVSDDENEDETEEMKGFIVPDSKPRLENGGGDSSDDDEDENVLLCKGDRVKVRWKGGMKYYNGHVTKVHPSKKKFNIKYDDGAVEKDVQREFIRKIYLDISSVKPKAKRHKKEPNVSSLDDLKAAILGKNKMRKQAFDDFARRYTS